MDVGSGRIRAPGTGWLHLASVVTAVVDISILQYYTKTGICNNRALVLTRFDVQQRFQQRLVAVFSHEARRL